MSSSSEAGWDRQGSQRLPAATGPAWLCEALTNQLCCGSCAQGSISTFWAREKRAGAALHGARQERGEGGPLLPPSGPLSSAWTLSTPSVPPGKGSLRWA